MRPIQALICFWVCTTSSVAIAGTISSAVSYNGSADLGAQLTGPTFNPNLGTLTGVELAITGSYNPSIFFDGFHQGTIPTESQLDYSIFGFSGSFGIYDLNARTSRSGTTLTGPVENFSVRIDPADVQAYVSLGNNSFPRSLGFINLYSVAANGNWGGDFSDNSLYSGQTTITYTYTPVPEPSTLSVVGAGGLLLLVLTQTRGRRDRG